MYARHSVLRMNKLLKDIFKYNPNWYIRNILQNILICIHANFMDFIKNWGNMTNSCWPNMKYIYIPLVEISDFLKWLFWSYCLCLCLVAQSCLMVCDPMDCSPLRSSVRGDSPGKKTRAGCHALLQGIFPTQGLKPGLLHCRRILYHLRLQGSPLVLYLVNKNIYFTIYSPSTHRFSAIFTKLKAVLSSVTSFNIIQPNFNQKHLFRFKF